MDNYLVEWYVEIYKNAYGLNTDYTDIILTFDAYLKRVINSVAFNIFANIVMMIGVVLLLYHFFSDMAERAAMRQTSVLSVAKSFGLLFATLMVIFHTKEIFILLTRFMNLLGESLTVADRGMVNVSAFLSNEVVLTLLDRCVTNHFGLWTVIGYTLTALPLVLVCFGTKLYVTYFAAKRVIQLFIYYMFAPIGVADIFEEAPGGGLNLYSSGMRYLRVMASIMLQLAVIAAISLTLPMISSAVKTGYYVERGESVSTPEGELEAKYGTSATYPLRHFEYTEHRGDVTRIEADGMNGVYSAIESISGALDGTVDDTGSDEKLGEDEICLLSDVIASDGTVKDPAKADDILSDLNYRMTVSSATLFFNWCTGSDGSKIAMMLLLMAIRVMALLVAPMLCNYIVGAAV